MAGLEAHIPGLRDAGERYRKSQIEAFVGVEAEIAGVITPRAFTPQMYIELECVGNGFFDKSKGGVSALDILQFLWRVSEKFARDVPDLRREFHQALAGANGDDLRAGIEGYLARVTSAMPHGGAEGAHSITAWPSILVDLFASEYGWSEHEVMNTPFRRLWQYAHRVYSRKDPTHREVAPEQVRLKVEFLNALNGKK